MKAPISILLLSLLCAGSASAAVLVQYSANGITMPAVTAPTTTASGVGATSITDNNLGSFSFATVNSQSVLAVAPNVTRTTLSAVQTFTDATYFSFTVTADAGQVISLSSLTFQAAAGGASTPRAFYVASSVTGFTSSSVLLTDYRDVSTGTLPQTPALETYSVDLSGISFQGLESVTFRFYVQTTATNATVQFDNIVLNGTVSAVPEPAGAAAITALAVVVISACRRRVLRRADPSSH